MCYYKKKEYYHIISDLSNRTKLLSCLAVEDPFRLLSALLVLQDASPYTARHFESSVTVHDTDVNEAWPSFRVLSKQKRYFLVLTLCTVEACICHCVNNMCVLQNTKDVQLHQIYLLLANVRRKINILASFEKVDQEKWRSWSSSSMLLQSWIINTSLNRYSLMKYSGIQYNLIYFKENIRNC